MMLSKIEVYKEDSSKKKKRKVQFDKGLAKNECSGSDHIQKRHISAHY